MSCLPVPPSAPPCRLFYYDQLASQEKVIELTIKESATGGHTGRAERSPGGRGGSGEWGEPPIEFVLETKWPRIQVDWNGSEPIL